MAGAREVSTSGATARFNPPPNWPEPPAEGWTPPADWVPQRVWGPVPTGWHLWLEDDSTAVDGPLQASEDVPASGARPRQRIDTYPVAVLNPGMYSDNHLQAEDYGFPPAKPRRSRPRLRLGMHITVTVLGLLLLAATVVAFVFARDFAITTLPTMSQAALLLAVPSLAVARPVAPPDGR